MEGLTIKYTSDFAACSHGSTSEYKGQIKKQGQQGCMECKMFWANPLSNQNIGKKMMRTDPINNEYEKHIKQSKEKDNVAPIV